MLVGDLDSISALGLAWATEHVEVVRHPIDKAATDTELAIAHAATYDPARILLVAGQGDRLDHAIAALGALGAPELAGVAHRWRRGGATTSCTSSTPPTPSSSTCPPGTVFSVLAMHGPARGVTVSGARWPLTDHDLAPLVGLGVSNVAAPTPTNRCPSPLPTGSSPSSSPEPPREPPPRHRHRRHRRPAARRLR